MIVRCALLSALALTVSLTFPRTCAAHEGHSAVIAALTDSIQRQPNRPILYLRRGEMLQRGGHPLRALADFERAEALDPGRVDTALCGADVLVDLGRAHDALTILEVDPGARQSAAFFRIQSRALEQMGRPADAAKALARAVQLDPRPGPDAVLEQVRLVLAHDGAAMDEALAVLDRGLARLGPAIALVEKAIELEVRRGNHDAALARLDEIGPRLKQPEVVWARRGDILDLAGRHLEARAAWTEAVAQIDQLSARRRSRPSTASLQERLRVLLQSSLVQGETGARDTQQP